ncbi:hypothetical protein [Mycobacterium sp. 141]|uniref:hypothetical protein n=1 Tax=Mycobacterium sp. 141 TaxID=1120797 RepID=UPI0003A414D3|nr:hypothetical protein [Mycobacterium sp. 141]
MRVTWALGAVASAVIGLVCASAGLASADETAQQVISRLQSQGYTVNIDRVGTAPIDQCVVTSVRNPQQVTQWVPYTGPGRGNSNGNNRMLVQVVTSQTVSVSLNCQR